MVEYSQDGLSQTFQALSDPTRLAIVARLRRGEANVGELARPFDMSLNAVSKHLRVLERAALVRRRVVGREHRFSLDAAPLAPAADWLQSYRSIWDQQFDRLDTYLRQSDDVADVRRDRNPSDSDTGDTA